MNGQTRILPLLNSLTARAMWAVQKQAPRTARQRNTERKDVFMAPNRPPIRLDSLRVGLRCKLPGGTLYSRLGSVLPRVSPCSKTDVPRPF